MSDLFDKLNLLLRSSLDNMLSNHPASSEQPRPDDTPPEALTARSIANLERQIVTMRKQVESALSDEDAMQERLAKLQTQVESYDQAADAALERGDEEEARRLIQQMQQQRRLATMVNAELEDHRSATSEFIVRVNMLEATVSDAKRSQGELPPEPTAAKPAIPISPDLVEFGKVTSTVITDAVKSLRERAEAALAPMVPRPPDQTPATSPTSTAPAANVPAIKRETPIEPAAADAPAVPIKVKLNPTSEAPAVPTPPAAAPSKPISDKDVDDDLDRRRSRLSKPD